MINIDDIMNYSPIGRRAPPFYRFYELYDATPELRRCHDGRRGALFKYIAAAAFMRCHLGTPYAAIA